MFILGQTVCGGNLSATPTYVDTNKITALSLTGAIIDDLYVTKKTDLNYDVLNLIWDYSTILYARFNGNLLAGNIDFALNSIDGVLIKQRIKGEAKWHTIYEVPIHSAENLSFQFHYKYASGNKTLYEFALVPLLNGNIEGDYAVSECVSDFDGYYIIDKDNTLHSVLNLSYNQERNAKTETIESPNRKYPYAVTNSVANFDSGSAEMTFIRFDYDNKVFDIENARNYRKEITSILSNGRPKVFKNFEGKSWLVVITGNVSETQDGHFNNVVTNINWVEIGDVANSIDMYDAGLIDTDVDKFLG